MAMEISRRRETSARLITRDRKDRDLKMRDSKETETAEGFEES